jgi:hypothetical protein
MSVFLNSTTYVVLTDNASYDTNIVHAVKKILENNAL